MRNWIKENICSMESKEFKVDSIINFILLLTIALMPYVVYKHTYSPYIDGKAFFLYGVGILLFILALLSKQDLLMIFTEKIIIIAFGVALIFSTIFAINPGLALMGNKNRNEGLLMFFVYILLFIMAAKYINLTNKRIDILLLVSCLMAIYSIVEFYQIDPLQVYLIRSVKYDQAMSFLGNRNFLSSYIILFIGVATLLYIFKGKIKYLIVSSILFASLLCTLTRSGWVGFAVMLLFAAIIMFKKRELRKRFLAILLSFCVIFMILDFTTDNSISSRFSSMTSDAGRLLNGDTSDLGTSRSDIWKMVIKSIKMHPIMGGGLDSLQLRLVRDVPKDNENLIVKSNQIIDKAHNEFLELWASGGFFAFFFYVILLVVIYKNIIRNIKESKYKVMFICLTGYLVQSLFNISVIGVAPLYWIFLGTIVNSYRNREAKNTNDVRV